MFEYAKRFKEQVYAEGRAEGKVAGRKEVFDALREAQRKGVPLETVLEAYTAENDDNTNGNDTANSEK